jgi:exopolyphosphatase / guanosine-5'-triphosphate,3'-diphosphate pyrophosphatase
MKSNGNPSIIAAIDVGSNAVRLEMARALPDGNIETVHQERDPVRPGEGLFTTGIMPAEVVDRLVSTLRRYAALCRRHKAKVRAVATSAMREAHNRNDIIRRIRRETGLDLEIISGKEEARLTCLGVLAGKRPRARSLCIDVGGGSTEVATAIGDRPENLWSLAIGAVRLSQMFKLSGAVKPKQLKILREYVDEAVAESLPTGFPGFPSVALGSSGTARAVVTFAVSEGAPHATARQLERAVDQLVRMGPEGRRRQFDRGRADVIVAGAVILEALARRLRLQAITAVDRGLRHGVLVDLVRRCSRQQDHSLADAAVALGRRFYFDRAHAQHVSALALSLFDQLAPVHKLPLAVRPIFEVASLLHDIGNAVSYQRHHRHSEYLIRNADIPGLADRERDLAARIARFHRRSPPDLHHAGMEGLLPSEARTVRKLATLLRIADALDRSHSQPVRQLHATHRGRDVRVRLSTRSAVDLEIWDVARESSLFRQVFGANLRVESHG